MVENRKLFYAIRIVFVVLFTCCCSNISMYPHNNNEIVVEHSISGSNNSSNNNNNNNNNNNRYNEAALDSNSNQNYDDENNSEFIIVAEIEQEQQQQNQKQQLQQDYTLQFNNTEWSQNQQLQNMGIWQVEEVDTVKEKIESITTADNLDDLIFLDKRPINHHQQRLYGQHQQKHNHPHHQQEHHINNDGSITSYNDDDAEDTIFSFKIADNANERPQKIDLPTTHSNDDNVDNDERITGDDTAHEESPTPTAAITPLDLSDFLHLIPAKKVKTIVQYHYHNDPEVQRAYAFMSSPEFKMFKYQLIAIPEISTFLHYLNKSGLDLIQFVEAVTNFTKYNFNITTGNSMEIDDIIGSGLEAEDGSVGGDAEKSIAELVQFELSVDDTMAKELKTSTTLELEKTFRTLNWETSTTSLQEKSTIAKSPTITTELSATEMPPTTYEATKQQEQQKLNGLHGLVDSILETLPQDQILAIFFDKLETDETFSKFVERIGRPEFARILQRLQDSVPLRNIVFTLNNNSIYITKIVDSFKEYFFLGAF